MVGNLCLAFVSRDTAVRYGMEKQYTKIERNSEYELDGDYHV